MIPIEVTCAIIEHDGLILATQRSEGMSNPHKWEFPGGKVASGESLEECLVRELREELFCQVRIVSPLPPVTHAYPDKVIVLCPFVCELDGPMPVILEHESLGWFTREELQELDWSDADVAVLQEYLDSTRSPK